MSSAKKTVTRATGLIDEQEQLEPAKHTEAALRRLTSRLNNAEESYESAYKSLEDPTEVEYEAYTDFQSSVEDQRARVEHLKLMHTAYAEAEDLLELLEYWEGLSTEDLRVKAEREIDSLQTQFDKFVELTRPRKLASSPQIKSLVNDMRKRFDHLKKEATPAASSSDSSAAAHCDEDTGSSMRQGIKPRTLPLPVYSGELADWRSFWRRFLDYFDRMPRLTTDEMLIFLLECIRDQSACNIIKDALQNGDSFEFVEKRLAVKFD